MAIVNVAGSGGGRGDGEAVTETVAERLRNRQRNVSGGLSVKGAGASGVDYCPLPIEELLTQQSGDAL